MEKLPKDIIVSLALELNLEDIVMLCQTTSRFNEKICQNNIFWLNKLIKDYGLKVSLKEAKKEYLLINKTLKLEPRRILKLGLETENFKMVKAAIDAGADLNFTIGFMFPISLSLTLKDNRSIIYLLDKTFENANEEKIYVIIQNILDILTSKKYNYGKKCIIFLNFYDIFLPYLSKIVDNNKFKIFWKQSLFKLDEFHKEGECFNDLFYNKWIEFYKNLAK